MEIATGTKLGAYEISSRLGAGGMGEVYRARDPRLNRQVAVKIISGAFVSEPQRLQRFEQEARAAAALNHPNILAVHDIGAQDGTAYIVSELLEGETLRQALRSGPLPVRKAIEYGLQIACGLAAAHDKGIVHRDLKPENIFVTEDGRIKLLDFGLAKFTAPTACDTGQTTTGEILSEPGTVLGTIGYMSPEQVRARPVDARSDLFSFGAILYEMLSGNRAFRGESAAETMAAIVREDPPEMTTSNRAIPPGLERIVRHCLEKAPAERFQSAHDLAFNLEALTGTSQLSGRLELPPEPRRRWVVPALAVLIAIVAMAAAYFVGRGARPASAPQFAQVTFRSGTLYRARFAPDGESIFYSAAWEGAPTELFGSRYGVTESRPIAPDTLLAAVSSRSQLAVILKPTYKAYGSVPLAEGTLALLPMEGGAPRPVLPHVEWADWAPDGTDLAVIRAPEKPGGDFRTNLLQYPVDKTIYEPPRGWISDVRFSPDGKRLAFEEHIPFGDDGKVVVIDTAGHKVAESPHYASVNSLAWASNDEVWFTGSSGSDSRAVQAMTLKGRTRTVYRAPADVTIYDIASNGRVLLSNDNSRLLLMGGVTGAPDMNLSWFNWSLAAGISQDGSSLVFSESSVSVGGEPKVFLRKLDHSPAVMLGDGMPTEISPDGNWVATLDNKEPANITLLPTGVGRPRQLTSNGWEYTRSIHWTPDSKALLVYAKPPGKAAQVFLLDISTKQMRPLLPEGVAGAIPSPDGRLLLAYKDRTPMVYDMAGTQLRSLPKLADNEAMDTWATDGKSVLVWNCAIPPTLERMDAVTGRRVRIAQITPPEPTGLVNTTFCRASPDAKAHIYSGYRLLNDLFVVTGLR